MKAFYSKHFCLPPLIKEKLYRKYLFLFLQELSCAQCYCSSEGLDPQDCYASYKDFIAQLEDVKR